MGIEFPTNVNRRACVERGLLADPKKKPLRESLNGLHLNSKRSANLEFPDRLFPPDCAKRAPDAVVAGCHGTGINVFRNETD